MSAAKPDSPAPSLNAEQLTKEIKQTREQLGGAVEQLAAKTDVKRQLGQLRDTARQAVLADKSRRTVGLAAAGVFAIVACVLLLRWRADR